MSEELNTEATQAAPEGTTAPETTANENAAQVEQQTQPAETTQETTQEPEAPKRDPWYMRRIDELTKARREEERKNAALRALLEQRNAPATSATTPQQTSQQTPDPYQLANQIAQQRVQEQSLNDAANRTYDAGKAVYGADFDVAVQTLQQVTDLSQRADFLEAVTALPNAHDVYHYLGKNPDEAAHILSLSPVRMAIELATVAGKVGRPKAQSKAPAPISAVGRTASPSSELSDDLSTADWIARREAQLEKRRQR